MHRPARVQGRPGTVTVTVTRPRVTDGPWSNAWARGPAALAMLLGPELVIRVGRLLRTRDGPGPATVTARSRCCRFPGPGRTRNDTNLLRTRDGPATVLPVPRPGSDSEFGLPRRPWAFKLAGTLAAGSDHLLSLCRWPSHVVTPGQIRV
jgi:hypothetical protein